MAELPPDISGLPVIQPSAEEVSAYEQQFGPPPLNPIRDLTAPELADLASVDKENFELVSAFRANKDLWADQSVVSKVADAHNLIRQRGFSLRDLPTPKRAAGLALDVAKGFGKQLWNYGSAAVETAMGIGADLTGQEGIARALEQQAQQRIAENIAGSEQALFGLADMGVRAAQKTGRAVGIAKPLTAQTPEEKVADLWTAVGTGEAQEDIGRGAGGFLQPVGGAVISELEAAGKPVRPEETAALAAGDPFSFYTFGKAFQVAGSAVPAVARQAATQVGQRAGAVAEQAAGAGVRALGKLTELGGRAAEITGKAAPVIAATGAAVSGQPIAALAILGGGTTAGRAVQVAGRGAATAGKEVTEIGRQVAGKPIVSPLAQGVRDVAGALPGAAGEIITGTAADLGLAAVSSETPQQTESAVGIGTVIGGLAGAKRIAGRVISGQLIAPREYGISTPTASSGNFPRFDQMHSAAYSSAPPGVRARLNAVREFASGAKVDTDVFLASDAATLERALIESGVDSATAKTFSEQEGFFTTSLPDKAGNSRRVIIAKNVEATPHESFHAFQDVLGEAANREIDNLVRSEYGPQWDAEGTRYAQRLVGDLGNRAWEEVILDESGWGLDAAKEKIFREVYNMVESETGSAPPDAHVRDLADPEIVRIFNEAQSRNPAARSEQFWREILSPEEAKSEADRYIARELAAENFDAVFKQRGGSLQTRPGLLQRLSRVVGTLMSTLGAEPLAGRRTEIGQIEPRFAVTERVAKLAQDPTPRTQTDTRPTVTTPVPPRGALPSSPEGRQQVADEARTIAEQAPDSPQPGGTRSPRELLGHIAEAIAQQAGVRINYLSAPGEPAAATTSNRTARRAIIEAFRTMPAAARSLWEKSFFPERVRKTSKGFQVMGWAPEVFASNAHKLARTLSELPNGQSLTPYPLDTVNKTFTDAGWQQLFADTQNFVRNQMAGQTGAGDPLVVPRDITDRGFFAPPSSPARAVDLAQPQADTINMLFNLRIPETPRIESGKFPLNVAGQEVSMATAGGPQRLSVPVEPRAPFSGERAQALGIEGRSILEVNPVRSAIESAVAQAKLELPSFIEAIQKLNLENIKEVELAPELPQFRGNTLTLTAGFQPSADPRAIKAAAVKDNETGRIFEGSWHGEAYEVAERAINRTIETASEFKEGFVTNSGEFLDREQATNRGIELKQLPSSILQENKYLEATRFDEKRQFQPSADPRAVKSVSGEKEYIKEAAMLMPDGVIFRGTWHGEALDKAAATGRYTDDQLAAPPGGFMTSTDRYVSREDALRIAESAKQVAREEYQRYSGVRESAYPKGVPLESTTFQGVRQFQPVAESARKLTEMTPEEWNMIAKTFKGKFGGGLTGWAWELGSQAKTIEDVLALKSASEQLREVGASIKISDPDGFNRKMNVVGRGQAAREAYEAATGRTLDDKEGSAVSGIRKYFDPNYNPPVPPKDFSAQAQPERLRSQAEPEDFEGAREEAIRIKTGLLANTKEGNEGWSEAKQLQRFGKTKEDRRFGKAVVDWVFHLRDTEALGPEPTGSFGISNNERAFLAEPGLDYIPIARRAVEGMSLPEYLRLGGHEAVTAAIEKLKAGLTPEEWAKLYQRERTLIEKFASEWSDPGIVERVRVMYEEAGAALNLRNRERYENAGLPYPGDKPFQFQPEAGDTPEFKLRKPSSGFSKAWILPDGSPVQLGGKWHHEWLNENAEQYGISQTKDADSRVEALRKGFARINYGQNGGRLTVEARAADWAKLRPSVQQFIETNLDQIDNLRVELFNDDVSAVADSQSAKFMNMNSDQERLASIPFMESSPAGGTTGGSVTGIAQARARQFQPRKAGEEEISEALDLSKENILRRWNAYFGESLPEMMKSGIDSNLEWENFGDIVSETANERDFVITPEVLKDAGYKSIDIRLGPSFHDPRTWPSLRMDDSGKWPLTDAGVKQAHDFARDYENKVWEYSRKNQFQPGAEEQPEFAGMPEGTRPMLTTSQLASMSRKELMDHFPEAIVPKRSADSIPSKLREAPLVKDAEDPVQTYADKLAEFGRSVETTPEYQMGRKWYSEFSGQLKARFGADARVFAELLAATSPQTSVEINFKFALDALEGFKSGRFKQNIKKFEQGLQMIANEKWLSWYNRELNAGRISDPPAKPTAAAFMARWIENHDIKPRQSNGKLFGINSIPVLQVAARKWLEQNKGPKVANFVENLLGEGTEATIDLWADRTLRRLGYADFQERWRILPVNKQGVSDEDFAFAQSIFRNAAGQLGMRPSELQAAVWFAEKQLWADNGWSRLDLGDFREEMKKTDRLRAEIRGREQQPVEATPDLLSVQPRDIVR